jgi:hypothetical protein
MSPELFLPGWPQSISQAVGHAVGRSGLFGIPSHSLFSDERFEAAELSLGDPECFQRVWGLRQNHHTIWIELKEASVEQSMVQYAKHEPIARIIRSAGLLRH